MKSIKELLELTDIPKLEDCNLKLIQEFHDEFLGKYIFIYKLNNSLELKIRFYTENLPHLLGIQKVVKDNKVKKLYQGKNGYDGISDGRITIDLLKKLDNQLKNEDKQLAAITSKITCFHLIPKLLDECSIVKFYPERVKGRCTLRSEFILFHEELGLKLHLGVLKDTDNSTIYVPETFIVKGSRDRDKNRLTEKQEFKSIVERDKILI
ncbi:PBECR4 domain-containing protein [Clostridium sp.]|uniref:PBECR4 domain-containing protein n=1 Tax=Clostridium sp. TaxID=1506 RepID=UPI00283BD844|nr:PBECR4 domain-containing protein [Clostridium sp.]MDR3598494.1 PBECR4 domain-containing protein [Clostridium sp.]